jgi:hypothetical protein
MTSEEIKRIRQDLAVAIEQQQRINQQITEGKIASPSCRPPIWSSRS